MKNLQSRNSRAVLLVYAPLICAMPVSPVLASAGVVYDFAVRSVDQNFALGSPAAPVGAPRETQYFVEDGKVRIGGSVAKTIYVFKDRIIYIVDNTSRTVHVLKHATISEIAAHYAAAVKQLEDAAANAPADERADAERKASDMKAASDRLRKSVPREFRLTARFETIDGHECRIWEERENDTKRLELCLAPAAALHGGAEIIEGMKTLSQFRQGSVFALGIDFGLSDWWPDISRLAGVPLLIREFKYESEISEITLTAVRDGTFGAAFFDTPEGYSLQDGPDYTQ